jgi:muramoyltetrapeptide carboxypeptidase LdcA involved in peptidoglycan recycling
MSVRYPAPLQPGDVIGVTSPSSGVSEDLRPRLDFCVRHLEQRGYQVVVGRCMDGTRVTSAPAADRSAELMTMLLDPQVRAVVPPWGGELAIDLLPLLDFDALAAAEPAWLVGYSDLSTLMTPLTLRTGIATLHGPNLMDTPFHTPDPLVHWLDVAEAGPGATVTQGATSHHQEAWPDFRVAPEERDMRLTVPGGWTRLGDRAAQVSASGRLVGGCLETLSLLPGTPFGDVAAFASRHAPEGLIVFLEVAESNAVVAARMLHHLRLAGWFDRATAVLIGRTEGPATGGYTQLDALTDTLGDLPVPVLHDVDVGHVPPQLALVNGALATVELNGEKAALVQRLV